MNIKECYVSKNGISCFTDINTMHNIKHINNNNFLINAKNGFLFYISLRLTEFVIVDFMKNKDILFKNIDNDYFLTSIIFN
tara:strand:- start:7670 stop:7912 length:243 start_codon:yes stop_codon:yes gene_type:complete